MALNDTFIKNSTKFSGKPSGDKYSDGGGLYLHVTASGKYWRMNYRIHGKQKTLALGVYPATTLAKARQGRDKAKELMTEGGDPSTAKQAASHAAKLAASSTYETVAREFHKVKSEGWSEAHVTKWIRMNEIYLFPEIGHMPISSIKARQMLDALRKVEAKGILSTAHDLQQMSGQVFRYAVQTGRIDQNPVPDLKGALKPHISKHFAATLDPVKAGELLRAIDAYSGQPTTLAALQLSALLWQRPGNIRALEWTWIDFHSSMLKIPPTDMKLKKQEKKNGRPHLVPLPRQAIVILNALQPLTGGGRYVFPSARSSQRPMSDGTINAALRRMDFGHDDQVAHGFRAMARTMIAERLHGVPEALVEAQLGHGKSGPLGGAYDRAEYMAQRTDMMQVWADYLDKLRIGEDVSQLQPVPQ